MSYLDRPSADITKIANGWKLDLSWETNENKDDTDYHSEEWMFATWEEAIEKARKFFEDLEPKTGEQIPTNEVSVSN